jgi:integrase
MAWIKIGNTICIVNGLILNNGLHYFQQAIPRALQSVVGKKTIKIRLRPEDGSYVVQCERYKEQHTAFFKALLNDPTLSTLEMKTAARQLLRQFGLDPGDGLKEVTVRTAGDDDVNHIDDYDTQAHLNEIHEFAESAAKAQGKMVKTALELLKNQSKVTLSEAFQVYLANHLKGKSKYFSDNQYQHWKKLIGMVGDIALEELTRAHAHQYRDLRLEQGVTAASVQREINVLRAIINVALVETSLEKPNCFKGLKIPQVGEKPIDRKPYTRAEIRILIEAALEVADERRLIVLLLAVTGARFSEVLGLRKIDVDLINLTLHFTDHSGRSLKNTYSSREVPLLEIALVPLQLQISASSTDFVFPAYANASKTESDAANKTINKWAERLVAGKTMHCFRHSLRDELRAIGCPDSISKEIGGWGRKSDVSEQYGIGYPLQIKRDWLNKAYAWLEGPRSER